MKNSSYLPAYEDGTDRVFRKVGIQNSDAGELPRRNNTNGDLFPKPEFTKQKSCSPTVIFLMWMRIRKEAVLDC
jgi:hypothetical protein